MNKRLKELVKQSVGLSFSQNGRLNGGSVQKFTKAFKSLSSSDAIFTLTEYSKGLKRAISEKTMVIGSPSKLSKIQTETLVSAFGKNYPISKIETQIDPGLIGGIRIKIGDHVFDDSINQKINKLGEALNG